MTKLERRLLAALRGLVNFTKGMENWPEVKEAEAAIAEAEAAEGRDCSDCRGLGFFDRKTDKPTSDRNVRRSRKCGECLGTGKVGAQ